MKKAQVNQIFIFILILIVISFTIVFGYRAIKNLTKQSDETLIIMFENGLKKDIKSNMAYGFENLIETELSLKYERICFVNLSYDENLVPDEYVLIKSSVRSGVKDNVFIGNNLERTFEIEHLEVTDGFFCIDNTAGFIKLHVKGLGDRAIITSVN